MCLACVEYLNGNLTWQEFKNNKAEFSDKEVHSKNALWYAQLDEGIDELKGSLDEQKTK